MEAHQFVWTVVAVFVANMLTIWAVYGMWRTTKDDSLKSIGIALAPLLIAGAIAAAAKWG